MFWARFQSCEKRLISFFMSLSVCPSVRMQQLFSHWMDYHNTLYLSIFRIYVQKIQVSQKSEKNNGYFAWKPVDLETFFLKFIEKVKTRVLCSETFFFKNVVVYEIDPKKYGRAVEATADNIHVTRDLRFVCWISKAKNTNSEYFCFSAATVVWRTPSMSHCTYIAVLFNVKSGGTELTIGLERFSLFHYVHLIHYLKKCWRIIICDTFYWKIIFCRIIGWL